MAEINKMAEMANLQNTGLIQCQSSWLHITLVSPGGGTQFITELMPLCVLYDVSNEGKLQLWSRFLFRKISSKMILKGLCLKFHYLKS